MRRSYAVVWRSNGGPICVGRLDLGAGVELEGVDADGVRAVEVVDDAAVVELASRSERLRDTPTVLVTRENGDPLEVASLSGPGTTLEILEDLAKAGATIARTPS